MGAIIAKYRHKRNAHTHKAGILPQLKETTGILAEKYGPFLKMLGF